MRQIEIVLLKDNEEVFALLPHENYNEELWGKNMKIKVTAEGKGMCSLLFAEQCDEISVSEAKWVIKMVEEIYQDYLIVSIPKCNII